MGEISVSLVKLALWQRALPERLEVGGMGIGDWAWEGELELPWKPSEGSYQGCLFFLSLDVVLGEVRRME